MQDCTSIDPEAVKKNSDNLLQAKILLDKIRKDNLTVMRQSEFDDSKEDYESNIEHLISGVEKQQMKDLFNTAENALGRNDKIFENLISTIKSKCTMLRFENDDKFVIGLFMSLRESLYAFTNKDEARRLINLGENAINQNDFDKLRGIIVSLFRLMRSSRDVEGISDITNIMRG